MADTWQINIYKINSETKPTKKAFIELEKMMSKGFAFEATQITKV